MNNLQLHDYSGLYSAQDSFCFPCCKNFHFFPARKGGKYFKDSLFYSYYPPSHIFFWFFSPRREGKWKKMISVFLILHFFYHNHIFLFPSPPLSGSNLQNIYPCMTIKHFFLLAEKFETKYSLP